MMFGLNLSVGTAAAQPAFAPLEGAEVVTHIVLCYIAAALVLGGLLAQAARRYLRAKRQLARMQQALHTP